MNSKRLLMLIVALILIALSWWGVISARAGLVVRQLEREKVPLLYLAPKNALKVPGVLVAHGYAGSKQLMLGYAHVLAHAGYAVMLWDLMVADSTTSSIISPTSVSLFSLVFGIGSSTTKS
jgi:hypothetical protein